MAAAGDQLPSSGIEPTRKTFSGKGFWDGKSFELGTSTEEFVFTSQFRGSSDVEGHRGGRTRVGLTNRRDGQSRSTPRGRDETISSSESSESADIGPGEVSRAQRGAIVTGELLSQTTVGRGIPGIDENKAISKVFDRPGQGRVCGS